MGKRIKKLRMTAFMIAFVMLVNCLPFGAAAGESVEAAGTTETNSVPEMPKGNKNYADYMYTNCSGETKYENGKAYSTSTEAEPRVRFDMDSNWNKDLLPFTKDDTYVFGFDLVTTETKDGVAYQSARAILGAVNNDQLSLQFRGDSITLFLGTADQKWSVPFTRELGKSYRIDILVEPNAVSVWVDGSLEVNKMTLPIRTEMRTGIMFSYAIAEVTNIDLYYTAAEDFSSAPKLPEMPEGNRNYADYMPIASNDYYTFANGILTSASATNAADVTFGSLPFGTADTYVYGFDLTTEAAEANWKSVRIILGKIKDGETEKTLRMYFMGDSIGLYKDDNDIWKTRFNRSFGETYRVDMLVTPNAVSLWIDHVYVATINFSEKTAVETGVKFEFAKASLSNLNLYYTEQEDLSGVPQLPKMPEGNRDYADYMMVDSSSSYTFENGTVSSLSTAGGSTATFNSLPFEAEDTYVYGFTLNTKEADASWKSARIILGKVQNGTEEATLKMYIMDGSIQLFRVGNKEEWMWQTNFNRELGKEYRFEFLIEPGAVSLWIDHSYIGKVDISLTKTAAATGVHFELAKASLSDITLYYTKAENTALKLADIDGVDYTYDYLKDGKFTLLSNTQIFQDNAVKQENFDEINMCATMTYPEGTSTHSMLSGFYLGSAKRSVNGESKGNADIYIGYLPTGYGNGVINEIVLWDGGYDFVISSGGRMTDILPADADLNGAALTYQINYKESTDTLTFRIFANGKCAQWKIANVTTVISNGRENGSENNGKNTYTDFQWNLGLGLDKYAGNESIEVSNVAVWGDVTAKDILIVEDGTQSYPVIFCAEEGDTLPTGEYLEQTISIDGQDTDVRHYITGWKNAEGNAVSVYEAGKTYRPEFIDTKMLDVRVQYKKDGDNSTETEEKVITRFIGSVNKLDGYKEAGFILSTNERTLELDKGYKDITGITTVYEGLYETTEQSSVYREAKNIYDEYSKYVFAYDIGNLPTGQKIYARAYVELSDGTIVLGNVRKILTGENNLEELKETLLGKKLSVLGDSISTYTGYSNNAAVNSTTANNAICYDGNYILKDVNDTWWMQAVNETGMSLLVNNSYSGDRVCQYGQTRNQQLHADAGEQSGTKPDIIAVYLGINDFNGKRTVEDFSKDYNEMISKLVETYGEADVFLFNLVPNKGMGRSIAELEAFNEVIENTAETYNCTLVDLYHDSGMTLGTCYRYTGDGLHPNALGMDLLTNVFIDAMIEKY